MIFIQPKDLYRIENLNDSFFAKFQLVIYLG